MFFSVHDFFLETSFHLVGYYDTLIRPIERGKKQTKKKWNKYDHVMIVLFGCVNVMAVQYSFFFL